MSKNLIPRAPAAKIAPIVALLVVVPLCLGTAPARAESTHGADRTVKGVVIGAAAGAVTQAVRGHRSGVELLKGAGIGAAIGGAVGAYSDYDQERKARENAEKDARYSYDPYSSNGRYSSYDAERARYEQSRYDHRYDNRAGYARQARGQARNRARANARGCNH
jgi:hypothetical protein